MRRPTLGASSQRRALVTCCGVNPSESMRSRSQNRSSCLCCIAVLSLVKIVSPPAARGRSASPHCDSLSSRRVARASWAASLARAMCSMALRLILTKAGTALWRSTLRAYMSSPLLVSSRYSMPCSAIQRSMSIRGIRRRGRTILPFFRGIPRSPRRPAPRAAFSSMVSAWSFAWCATATRS